MASRALPKLSFRSWWLRRIGPTSNWSGRSTLPRSLDLTTGDSCSCPRADSSISFKPLHREDKLHWQISDCQAYCHAKCAETGLRQPLACAGPLQQAILLELSLAVGGQPVLGAEPAISLKAKIIFVAPLLECLSQLGHASADLSLNA